MNERITAELLLQIFDKKQLSDTKIGKIVKNFVNITLSILLRKLTLSPNDIPDISSWGDFIPQTDKRKFLFIFDDIERAACGIKELLGFINTFVEQYKAKVIIIGYKEKIGLICDNDKTDQLSKCNNNKESSLIDKNSELSIFSQYE